MEKNEYKEMSRKMDKQGMRVFISATAIVYSLSLIYCYSTGHLFETVLVGVVMLGLGILMRWVYTSK